MTVVANTGPLIALAKVDRLDLLQVLVPQVLVPERVLHELLAKPGVDARRLQAAVGTLIRAVPPPSNAAREDQVATLHLDDGERDVILLARSFSPPAAVLMDDAAGRGAAGRVGLSVIGFGGLLLAAKESGKIGSVVPLVEAARREGYWLSDGFVAALRKLALE